MHVLRSIAEITTTPNREDSGLRGVVWAGAATSRCACCRVLDGPLGAMAPKASGEKKFVEVDGMQQCLRARLRVMYKKEEFMDGAALLSHL